jgi:hypothetical protein
VISAERGLIRAFYKEHIGCLELGNPIQDPTEGLVCPCGTILGFPGVNPAVQETQTTPVTVVDSGPADGDPPPWDSPRSAGPPDPAGGDLDPDDWAAAAAEQKMIAEQEADEAVAGFEPDAYERDLIAEADAEMAQGGPGPAPAPPESKGELPEGHGVVGGSMVVPQDPILAAVNVIDATRPYTPAEVEAQLIDIEARLDRGAHFQRIWEERAYRTKMAYTLANARALVDSRAGSADVRRAEALLACQQQYEDQALADMMVRAVRESMHNLRSQLSGYQSIARSVGTTISGPHGYRT